MTLQRKDPDPPSDPEPASPPPGRASGGRVPWPEDPGDSSPPEATEPVEAPVSHRPAWRLMLLAVVVSSGSLAFASRPELRDRTEALWLSLLLPHALLAAFAIRRLWATDVDRKLLAPRGGDFSAGVLVAVALLFGLFWLRSSLFSSSAVQQGWLFQLYAQLGNHALAERSALVAPLVIATAACQEITWQALVQREVSASLGRWRGILATGLLFGVAAAPTMVTLSDPAAGLNPLVLLAALPVGLAWAGITAVTGRLWPAIFGHAVFLYFVAIHFGIPGLTASVG